VKGLISTQGYCPRNNRSYHRWCEDRSPSGSIVWHVHPCRKQHKQNKELSSLVVAHLISTKALVRFVQLKKKLPHYSRVIIDEATHCLAFIGRKENGRLFLQRAIRRKQFA
jgi:hypothetical protein